MIEEFNCKLSVAEQCRMVNISRSSFYAYKQQQPLNDQEIINAISAIYNQHPEYGSRRITAILKRQGINVNRKRTQRLMKLMNIQGVQKKRNLSIPRKDHQKYPYIARDNPITCINQVWSTDITYINTKWGTVYLVAVIDWHSRFILSSEMSNTMSEHFCIKALDDALKLGKPDIFNTDQGSQFTGNSFISILINSKIKPSMDGKGRATDNAPIERFWKSVKWEEVYLYEPKTFKELQRVIKKYIRFYNHERPHQSLNYKTPSEVHFDLEIKTVDANINFIYTKRELDIMQNL